MSDNTITDAFSRRNFLGVGTAALAGAGILSAVSAAGQVQQPYPAAEEKKPYPTKDDRSASALGPASSSSM